MQDGYDNGGSLSAYYSTTGSQRINFDGGAGHAAYPHVALEATASGDLALVGRAFITGGLVITPDPALLYPAATIDISDRAARYGAMQLELDRDVTLTLNRPPQEDQFFVVVFWSADMADRALTFGANFRVAASPIKTGGAGLVGIRQFMVINGAAVNIGGADGLV